MKITKTLSFSILLICSGCAGDAFLERGTKDEMDPLHTPSLHEVPDRPPKTPIAKREEIQHELEKDYQEQISHHPVTKPIHTKK